MPETDLQKTETMIEISEDNLGELLDKEWLITNNRGSYASGTVLGCNTRRYHGMLIASLHPPVERIVTLSNLIEVLSIDGVTYELSNFEFSDRLHPQGYRFLTYFEHNNGVHFHYEVDGVTVVKSIHLACDKDTLIVSYRIDGDGRQIEMALTPLVAMRDFHSLQSSSTSLFMDENDGYYTAHGIDPQGPAVHFSCQGASYECSTDWWYAMHYRQDTRRGQHDYEDIWASGTFTKAIDGNGEMNLVVQAAAGSQRPGPLDITPDDIADENERRMQELYTWADVRDDDERLLVKAADQFIVRRKINETQISTSILAGYHWFADWGRDTFIALPGLLLSSGRYAEARDVLSTFGSVLNRGQIPNRFDDYGGEPHYNSIDASLWFINAAYQYLLETDDKTTFNDHFRPMILEIVNAYTDGTRDNIHVEEDGLVFGGDDNTQLTWMDAKCNGVSFTPRFGKAVEINALWYNALNILKETASDDADKKQWNSRCKQVKNSFLEKFWNPENESLYDCIYPSGIPDAAVRPNQIYAVSLSFSCLTQKQQKSVLHVVTDHLLTPYGLRSLSFKDSRYRKTYVGDQFQRDSAYHQGTVWGFLIGPYMEAYLKVHKHTDKAKAKVRELLEPLMEHLKQDACIGSVNEIFDGDFPHRPKGCIAQAWSVGALLRIKKML